MLKAITHKPSKHLNNCEITFLSPQKINLEKAEIQHENYCQMLIDCGVSVENLEANLEYPDSTFVEDTAIVLDEVAIITSMGIASRVGETDFIEKHLSKYREIEKITLPAKIEGGDVLRIGKNLFVGNSTRTNSQGIEALSKIVRPFGYKVFEVTLRNSLHLKTACTALDNETVLLNSDWVNSKSFKSFKQIEVPKEEPFVANILKINETICIHKGFPKTIKILESLGYKTKIIDISEFLKAEAGLTCLSLIFK